MSWPDGGPWVVAATSIEADWELATAALCAASQARTAVLRIVDRARRDGGSGARGHDSFGTYIEVGAAGAGAPPMDDVVGLVEALTRAHGLVLVGGQGLAVPLGHSGWSLADLAWALRAPVVLVTGPGPGAVNHTTLAIEVLTGRGLAASVVALGAGEELGVLPVALAGRIPPDAADRPESFRTEAPGWFDPLLHATRGWRATTARSTRATPADPTVARAGSAVAPADPAGTPAYPSDTPSKGTGESPNPPAQEATGSPGGETRTGSPGRDATGGATVSGKRVLVVLCAVFVVSLMVLCGLNLAAGGRSTTAELRPITRSVELVPQHPVPTGAVAPRPVQVNPPARGPGPAACPQYAGSVVPTEPDAATTARVNAGWSRIERWLAAKAPRTRASLRPPATRARITALQERMSVAFPADLVASLRRHDGATLDGFALPSGYRLMSLDELVRDWEVNCLVGGEMPVGMDWWHRAFVPFAADVGGGSLLVDQRPGGHGRVGEFYPEDGTGFENWPASVADLLDGVARSLETGEPYAGRYRPTVEAGGRLGWTIPTVVPTPTPITR